MTFLLPLPVLGAVVFGSPLALAPMLAAVSPQDSRQEASHEGNGQEGEGQEKGDRQGIVVKRPWSPPPIESEAQVAFWVRLEGSDAAPIAVTVEEWNRYFEELYRVYPVEDHISMTYRIFQAMLDTKLVQLVYHETVPSTLERAEEVIKRLERGATWDRVVRQYTDDKSSKAGGGYQGPYRRQLQRYPLETDFFQLEEGEIAGPFLTKYGAEFFRCERHSEERGSPAEVVEVSYLILMFGSGLGKNQWPEYRRRIRLSSSHEFFRQILPPGMMESTGESTHFGPADVAPVGEPNVPLQMVLTGAPIYRPDSSADKSDADKSDAG